MPLKKASRPDEDSDVIENFELLDNLDVVQNETDWRMFQELDKYEKPRASAAQTTDAAESATSPTAADRK